MEKFKLKPKIFVYADDSQRDELLTIAPRNILDFNASLHGMFQNRRNIMDANGNVVGAAQETGIMALLRRFVVNWKLDFEIAFQGRKVGDLSRAISIGDKYSPDLSGDPGKKLDRRLAVAMLPLFDAGEDR